MGMCERAKLTGECGYCESGRGKVQSFRGHLGYRARGAPETNEDIDMAMSRQGSGTGGDAAHKGIDPWLDKAATHLHEWLTELTWEDGKKREPGTVMVVVEGGWWKAWLHDRDGKRSAWLSASTLPLLLGVVDEALATNNVAWRPDRR